jgi:hypothetical protein
MIWALIKAGQLFPESKPQDLFPYLSKEKISKMVSELGRKEINDLLHAIGASHPQVCVSMDESLIANRHTIICLIQFPDSGLKPIPFKMYTKGVKRSNYAKLCATVKFKLMKYGIDVVAFNGDGLKRENEACSPAFVKGYSKYFKVLIERDKQHPYKPPLPSWETQKSSTRENWISGVIYFAFLLQSPSPGVLARRSYWLSRISPPRGFRCEIADCSSQ